MILALECRDRSRKVGVPDIEAFRKKCDRTAIHRSIIVSASGFTKTALKKAEALEIGCLGLEEAACFDWCLAPGVEYTERDLLPGPPWEIETAGDFCRELRIYNVEGLPLDAATFTNLAQAALSQRPREMANEQDFLARTTPVTCSFVNIAAPAFHLIDRGRNIHPLTQLIMNVTYRVSYSIIPFSFRSYFDYARGRELYTAAIATIDRNTLHGDVVMHNDGTMIKVTFVPTRR